MSHLTTESAAPSAPPEARRALAVAEEQGECVNFYERQAALRAAFERTGDVAHLVAMEDDPMLNWMSAEWLHNDFAGSFSTVIEAFVKLGRLDASADAGYWCGVAAALRRAGVSAERSAEVFTDSLLARHALNATRAFRRRLHMHV
jgi:hypothetical protein